MTRKTTEPCRVRRGIVTTHPDGYVSGDSHYAATCCGKAECVQKLREDAKAVAGREAVFVADVDRGVSR